MIPIVDFFLEDKPPKYVTVAEPVLKTVFGQSMFWPAEEKTYMDSSMCGAVLEVLAVNWPYVAVKSYGEHGSTVGRIDCREAKFTPLSQEYVDVFLKQKKSKANTDGCLSFTNLQLDNC